jgi:hypothetical protein
VYGLLKSWSLWHLYVNYLQLKMWCGCLLLLIKLYFLCCFTCEKKYCLEVFGPALPLVFFGGSSLSDENGTTVHSLWIIFRLFLSFNCMDIMPTPLYKLCKLRLWKLMVVTRLLKIFLWPNPQTIGQLVLLYLITVDDWHISNLVFEKRCVGGQPNI